MPIYTPHDSFQCWVRNAVVEQYEAFDEQEFKETFKSEVLKDDSALYHYVDDELMPMEFPDWNSNERIVCHVIMKSVAWLELLEEIKGDIVEEDKCND